MKKILTGGIIAAICVSGMTLDVQANKSILHSDYLPKGEMPKANFLLDAFMPEKRQRVIDYVVERSDDGTTASMLEGSWTFILGENYFENSAGFISYEFEAEADENNMLTFTSEDHYDLKAKYSPKTHSLRFGRRFICQDGDLYIYQEPFSYDTEGAKIEKKTVFGYYSEYERAIIFDDNLGVAITAYGDRAGTDFKGYYDMVDLTVALLPQPDQWKSIGMATFTDGWLVPAFGDSAMENTYQVPAEQNVENENIYRLVNPYKYGPLAETNTCEKDGYIVFDVTDPGHVVFKLADAGYSNPERRCSSLFVFNHMGSLVFINPYYTKEEIIKEFGGEFAVTTFSGGVVNFDSTSSTPDVSFALQDVANRPRIWKDAEGKNVNATSAIILPGATEAAIRAMGLESDENVEYYTPQGLRISNPEPGQIVIRRQGSIVTKEIK